MPLSFLQANVVMFFTQLGFSGLNVTQDYAIQNLSNPELAFQLFKTVLGSTFFLILLLFKGERIREQFGLVFSWQYFPVFFSCSVCLAAFELFLIITLNDLGPTMVSIGIACTGSIAYALNLIFGVESIHCKKLLGSFLTVGGACLAVKLTWLDADVHDKNFGVFAMVTMVFSMVGYYALQKKLYPTFNVIFVTGISLTTACFMMFVVIMVWTNDFSIHWHDPKTLAALFYSSFVGQFLLYLTSNASNVVLSAPMICLYQGVQPIATPFLDMVRLCIFPDVTDTCEAPPIGIVLCAGFVSLGLALYGWGEYSAYRYQRALSGFSALNETLDSKPAGDEEEITVDCTTYTTSS